MYSQVHFNLPLFEKEVVHVALWQLSFPIMTEEKQIGRIMGKYLQTAHCP